ncbi:MAG: aromatic aminobenezylarsenical efflux permease ArsG family transporter [Proteobacteria bacterium]|nr:aromatic aminobenezylarsenical efflux permease ArsG family transporter [Pseudomonadota bacterium]
MFWLGALSAFWLGLLTAISPCPLATNIAAISFIGRKMSSPRRAFYSGAAYTLGRSLTYIVIAAVLVFGLTAVPQASWFLQKYMNQFLGPLLIIVGMFLLELIPLDFPALVSNKRMEKQAEQSGLISSGLLGIMFALSFCPVSAALFFGSLVPLSVKHESFLLMPMLYGIGTGLPVLAFALAIALGAKSLTQAFNRLGRVELWVRRGTGVIFILIGIYFCLRFIFVLF